MLSPETLEHYRRMSLSERLKFALEMMRNETVHLLAGPREVVKRRFELLQQENDLRNQRMLEGIARTMGRHE